MGAWRPFTLAMLLLLAGPAAAALGLAEPAGWAATRMHAGEGGFAVSLELTSGDGPGAYGLYVLDEQGAPLVALSGAIFGRPAEVHVTTPLAGSGASADPSPFMDGGMARGGGVSPCWTSTLWEWRGSSQRAALEVRCPHEGVHSVVVFAAGDILEWTHAVEGPAADVLEQTSGDSVFFARLDRFRRGTGYEYGLPIYRGGGSVRVHDDVTYTREVEHALFASFGSFADGMERGTLGVTPPAGARRDCPCSVLELDARGAWVFDARATRQYADEPLFVAGADVRLPSP